MNPDDIVITDAQKYRYEKGDSFILRIKGGDPTGRQAEEIARSFRRTLHLPPDTPVAVLGESMELLITGPFEVEAKGMNLDVSAGCLHCDEFFASETEPCDCPRDCGNPACGRAG